MPKNRPFEMQSSLASEFSDGHLLLQFKRQTEKTTYSIFDLGGSELKSGALTESEHHKIPVHDLTKGVYLLCIIDGDQLYKQRITLT